MVIDSVLFIIIIIIITSIIIIIITIGRGEVEQKQISRSKDMRCILVQYGFIPINHFRQK